MFTFEIEPQGFHALERLAELYEFKLGETMVVAGFESGGFRGFARFAGLLRLVPESGVFGENFGVEFGFPSLDRIGETAVGHGEFGGQGGGFLLGGFEFSLGLGAGGFECGGFAGRLVPDVAQFLEHVVEPLEFGAVLFERGFCKSGFAGGFREVGIEFGGAGLGEAEPSGKLFGGEFFLDQPAFEGFDLGVGIGVFLFEFEFLLFEEGAFLLENALFAEEFQGVDFIGLELFDLFPERLVLRGQVGDPLPVILLLFPETLLFGEVDAADLRFGPDGNGG